ncbi:hypothetical protein AB6D11_06540 [Vibrio splendidus]
MFGFDHYVKQKQRADKQIAKTEQLTPLFDSKFQVYISNDIKVNRTSAKAIAKIMSRKTGESLGVVNVELTREQYSPKFRACTDATQAYFSNHHSASSSSKHQEFLDYMTEKDMEVI